MSDLPITKPRPLHYVSPNALAADGGISFVEGMRLLAGASADLRHQGQTEEERPWMHVSAGEGMKENLAGLREPRQLDAVEPCDGLQATL